MKKTLALAAACIAFAAQAQTIQPGLWEFKHDMRMPGRPDVAAQMAQMREQMKNLPPEARKMMEQQMAGHGMGMGADGALRFAGPVPPQPGQLARLLAGMGLA